MKSASAFPPLLLALLLGTGVSAGQDSGASFFGNSYLEVPLEEAHSEITLHLKFLTGRGAGLLFLAAGHSDYLLVALRAGAVQVSLDLGSGEVQLNSHAGLKLDNVMEHDLKLKVGNGKMILLIDDHFNTATEITGTSQELNIHHGLYLGGAGDLDLPYLAGVSTPFRGCIQAATFNSLDLLALIMSNVIPRTVHEVKDGCSPEFSSSQDDPFSFTGPQSFIALPSWNAREEGSIEFRMTSKVKHAPLIFQSGPQHDFIYLEISNGFLRGTLNTGNGVVKLQNNIYVNDDQTHTIRLFIDAFKFEISVDNFVARTSKSGLHSFLDIRGNLLLGGFDDDTLDMLRDSQLGYILREDTTYRSFVGCMEDLRVNLEKKSLQDALVTKDISTGCENEDYEDEYDYYDAPTTQAPTPTPVVWQGLRASATEPCRLETGLPAIFNNFTRLLNLSPLIVQEGGTSYLELWNTQPTIDLASIGIRHSQVLFSVILDARYGYLELDIPGASTRKRFTLLDIIKHKVKYVHDGSEAFMDQLAFEVTVNTKVTIPDCLHRGQTFLFPISVTPINDPPEVVFPQGDIIEMLEHTRKVLSLDIVHSVDADTTCENLKFFIVGGKSMEGGYVEYGFQAGQVIDEFSCEDLEAGNVVYVHQSGPTKQLSLQASDGVSRGPTATLRIIAREPDILIGNNTGLIVSQGDTAIITLTNLSVETNAVKQNVDIFYRITGHLQFGEIHQQDISGEWKVVESFQQRDIEQGHLKYVSTDSEFHKEDITEKLGFDIQVGEKLLGNNTFFIKVKRSPIKMINMAPLEIKKSRQQNITIHELQATLEGKMSDPDSFQYVIIQAPRKGNLLLESQQLTESLSFTQEDLLGNRLSYRVTIKNSKETEDYFQYRIFVGSHSSPVYTYKIRIDKDPNAPILTNVLLSVLEGGEGIISADHLFVKSSISMNYNYEVIEGPQHGKLLRRTSSSQHSSDEVISEFTNDDLLQGSLLYQHDGSETTEDDIPFVAIKQDEGSAESQLGDREVEEVRGVFRVAIQPVNDNVPVQVVNKVFNVVRDGQRLLTTNDIAFTDKDSGSTDSQLVLVRRGVPFGSIVFVEDPAHQVYRFTQEDLRMKKVLFVHSGADQGWFQLQVSDGLHQVTALLEVQASEPYIEIVNNTGMVVHQGGDAILDGSVLRLETNMDIRNEDDIIFQIINRPVEGVLRKGTQPVSSFSQKDLVSGDMIYYHNGSSNIRDFFEFSVEANQVVVEDNVEITVILEGGNPPQVIHNERIYVFQGEAAEIKKEYLMVSDENSFPHQIVYTVRFPPQLGVLVETIHSESSDASLKNIQTFTQEDINVGRVLYLNSRPEPGSDPFTVDVSNGEKVLEDLVIQLEILPMTVPLTAQNITVDEGGSKVLSTDILQIPSSYFTNLNLEFTVVEPPRHGAIRNAERHGGESLLFFTWNEVEQQLILYEHDDSETVRDSFKLAVNASEIGRQSRDVTIVVVIQPVNDETPVLTINAGLQISDGAMAEITADILATIDKDSPPEKVVYSIQPPANGKVLQQMSSGNKEVQEFTQAQVNEGVIRYQHQGSPDGGFAFDISDGDNASPGHFFTVTAKNLVITMEAKEDVTVCPGAHQPITSQSLRAAINAKAPLSEPLMYTVVEPPRLGRLVSKRQLDSGSAGVSNFSQSEVDAVEIYYQHDMPLVPFWISQDAFSFRVSSSQAVTELHTLRVYISFEAQCPTLHSRLWANKGLNVDEHGSVTINTTFLDATNLLARIPEFNRSSYDVVFLLSKFPIHGYLSVADASIGERQPYFLQSHLDDAELEYTHNGSGSQGDSFKFTTWVWPRDQAITMPPHEEGSLVISDSFNISVWDVNVHRPQLLTQNPSLQVLQGSAVTLTVEHLNVVDLDSPPEEIEYTILAGPTSGFLAHSDNKALPITQFTQEDVNKGRLMFIVTGSSTSDVFTLRISDGYHPPILTSLAVKIFPAILTVTNRKPVELRQDQNQTTLTQDHILAVTDGEEQNVMYTITRPPQFGQLRVNQQVVHEFSQMQVDKGEVSFVFTDFSSSRDEFLFVAASGGANAPGIVSIIVKPLVTIHRGIVLPRGTTVLVDTYILDASELANKTNSDPTFKVLRAPRSSQFVKVSQGGKTHPMSADSFTQSDLEDGRIGLEVLEGEKGGHPLRNDSFQVELAANGVPPASATLKFSTSVYVSSISYQAKLLHVPQEPQASSDPLVDPFTLTVAPWLLVSEDSATANSTEVGISTTNQHSAVPTNNTPIHRSSLLGFLEANMFTIILPLCLIIILTILGLILLYYLIRKNKTGKHHVQGTSFKPKNGTLDQETFRKTDPNQAIPLSTMKPLGSKGPESPTSRSMETGGQADPELIQSCRTSNPALKNNQYWV